MSLIVENREEKYPPGFAEVATERVQSPAGIRQLVLQPSRRALGWAEIYYGGLSDTAKRVQKLFGNTYNMLLWFNFPKNVSDLKKAVVEFKESIFSGSAHQITKKSSWLYVRGSEVAGLFSSTLVVAHNGGLLSLSARALAITSTVGFMAMTALFVGAVVGLKKDLDTLEGAEYLSPTYKLAFARVFAKTLLAAMAFFGTNTYLFGASLVAPWVSLSVATAFLVLSISTYFYNEMVVKPDEKTSQL